MRIKLDPCRECMEMRAAHTRMVAAYARGDTDEGNKERDLILELAKQKAINFASNAGKFFLPNR